MAYPTEERTKINQDAIANITEQFFPSHNRQDRVWHGVVYKIYTDPDTCSTSYLLVVPYSPVLYNDAGDLVFDITGTHPLGGVTDSWPYVKVYPINCPCELTNLFYTPGDRIKFWVYNGTQGDADNIRGSFVTELEDNTFEAKVLPTSGMMPDGCRNEYTFIAVKPTFTPEGVEFGNYGSACGGGTFTGTCFNLTSYIAGAGARPNFPLNDSLLLRIYPWRNPDPNGIIPWFYGFHYSANQVQFGTVKTTYADCDSQLIVYTCGIDDDAHKVTLNIIAPTGPTIGYTFSEGQQVAFLAYDDGTKGVLISPYKQIAVTDSGAMTPQVPDLQLLSFDVDDFTVDAAGPCAVASTADISWNGLDVENCTGSYIKKRKSIVFANGFTVGDGAPDKSAKITLDISAGSGIDVNYDPASCGGMTITNVQPQTDIRWNATTKCLQKSFDNGATWTDIVCFTACPTE